MDRPFRGSLIGSKTGSADSRLRASGKTDLIKEALENLFYQEESERDSYELGEEYFGKYGSGDGTLSVSYRDRIKDKINVRLNSH